MTNAKLTAALSAALLFGAGTGYAVSEMTASTTGAGNLCDQYPRLCVQCGITAPCPTPAEGEWLCCNLSSGVCVVANGSCEAPNVFGYCENYTENANGSVTCHDEAE
jgi:hypothetical protein